MRKLLPGEIPMMRWWNWLYIIAGLLLTLTFIGVGAYAWTAPSRERTRKIEKLEREVKELKEKRKP